MAANVTRSVLVTGASGLLGRAILRVFQGDPTMKVTGLALSRVKGDLQKVDITKREEVSDIMHKVKPDFVIHSAAERRPDVVENQEEATHLLNVEATRYICEEAASLGAPVLYMSTDYVFDGTKPPYRETDDTNPLNKYGQSKLQGEVVTLEVSKENLILRVPILYGEIESLDESAVTVLFEKVQNTTVNCVMSDYERRYPTHVDDVAQVIKDLMKKRLQDNSLTGVFQWSGDENMTKYNMAVAMAEVCALPKDHIKSDKNPSGGAKRPYNAHLDSSRLEKLGISHRRPFKEGIEPCLKPYLN